MHPDNGWRKEHPLPAAKGSFGSFNALAIKNQELIRQLLESDYVPDKEEDPHGYDKAVLAKLRGLYGSCTAEDALNEKGDEPLLAVVRNLRNLFGGETTVIKSTTTGKKNATKTNLTAALSYLHTRGMPIRIKLC
jgi:endothelin-converting enzyme